MLTLARALSRHPDCLLADDLSLGLAPALVRWLLTAVRAAADTGVAVPVVKQHALQALELADRSYVPRSDGQGTAASSGRRHAPDPISSPWRIRETLVHTSPALSTAPVRGKHGE